MESLVIFPPTSSNLYPLEVETFKLCVWRAVSVSRRETGGNYHWA